MNVLVVRPKFVLSVVVLGAGLLTWVGCGTTDGEVLGANPTVDAATTLPNDAGATIDSSKDDEDARAERDAETDALPPDDAGVDGGNTNKIRCGTLTCDIAKGERCCIDATKPAKSSCETTTCPTNHFTRRCDGPEDCSNAPCCGGDYPWTASCSTPAVPQCAPLAQFCHSSADCPGTHCCSSQGMDTRTCKATPGVGDSCN